MSFDNQNPYGAQNQNPYASPNQTGPFQGGQPPVKVPDYLVWSIAMALCCSPICGILGIVFSIMANNEKQKGNYDLALKNANYAKISLTVGVALAVVVIVFYAILIGLGVFMENAGQL